MQKVITHNTVVITRAQPIKVFKTKSYRYNEKLRQAKKQEAISLRQNHRNVSQMSLNSQILTKPKSGNDCPAEDVCLCQYRDIVVLGRYDADLGNEWNCKIEKLLYKWRPKTSKPRTSVGNPLPSNINGTSNIYSTRISVMVWIRKDLPSAFAFSVIKIKVMLQNGMFGCS